MVKFFVPKQKKSDDFGVFVSRLKEQNIALLYNTNTRQKIVSGHVGCKYKNTFFSTVACAPKSDFFLTPKKLSLPPTRTLAAVCKPLPTVFLPQKTPFFLNFSILALAYGCSNRLIFFAPFCTVKNFKSYKTAFPATPFLF